MTRPTPIAALLTLMLIFSGQLAATAQGLAATGLWTPLCGGGVALVGGDGDTVLPCPDGVLSGAPLTPDAQLAPAPQSPGMPQLAVAARDLTTPGAPETARPRGPPALL